MADYINDIISAVITMAEASLPSGSTYKIVRGPLPPNNGFAIYMAVGSPNTTFQNKRIVHDFTLTLNGKHARQQTVSKLLNNMHEALTTTKEYPVTDNWEIANIETVSLPSYLDREENNQYLYGSSLRVRAYIY